MKEKRILSARKVHISPPSLCALCGKINEDLRLIRQLSISLLPWCQTEERQGADRGQTASPKDPPITGIPFGDLAELFDRRRRIPEEKALFPNVSRRVPEQMGDFPNNTRTTLQELGYFSRRILKRHPNRSGRNIEEE